MRSDHVFLKITGDEIEGYGNLMLVMSDMGAENKYSSVARAIRKGGVTVFEDVTIMKLAIKRGTIKTEKQ